jgi:23S rRNA U2552 (ribose-2'-O)-methylase RlmE/FtsJ
MQNPYIRLLFIAFLFMFLFQLEARLLTYVYLFHEGLLLIQAMLLGGGLLLLLQEVIPQKYNRFLDTHSPFLLVFLFLFQQFVFYYYNSFILDFLTLSLLFAVIFREITNLLSMKSNEFYALELLGSFVGVAVYALLVLWYLEEPLLVLVAGLLVIYAFAYTPTVKLRLAVLGLALLLVVGYAGIMKENSIPILLQCSPTGTSYGYKAVCLNDVAGIEPTASFSSLKGRSDMYVRGDGHNLTFLEVKNNGYRVSAANQERYRNEDWFDLLEMRIPKLAYTPGSKVLSIGAGAGSYVQALHEYIEDAQIKAVEIDGTVEQMYTSNLFTDFLPPRESYELVYEEGRRYMTLNDTNYDVITVAIEGINSSLSKYTDERTGLLYTKEALSTYISRLNPEGYLVLEQYYPQIDGGPPMAVKFLRTLEVASGVDRNTFSNNVYIYTWAFHNQPNAQRFMSTAYKPDGFTEQDIVVIRDWIQRLQTTDLGGGLNPHDITIIHEPDTAPDALTFATYFDQEIQDSIAASANTAVISDEKPFRHLVTTLPLPPFSYTIFAFMAAISVMAIHTVMQRHTSVRLSKILLSVWLGLVTFGLQYLLFYKTAAFLEVNLIFFSIFLLLPLSFGAIGGYLSTLLPQTYDWLIIILLVGVTYVLATVDVFAQSKLFILVLVAVVFVFAGILFPRLLAQANSPTEKRVLYAVNLVAGGFALMCMITLHATIGWTPTFLIVAAGSVLSLLLLRRGS